MRLIDQIPLPTRPGTTWAMAVLADRCQHCGERYSKHGAPEDIARAFGVPLDRRHLICPASDEAWNDFHALRRRASLHDFARDIRRHFAALDMTADERQRVLDLAREGD